MLEFKRKKINSFCLALMICARALTQLFDFSGSSILLALLGASVIYFNPPKYRVNKWKAFISIYVTAFFLISLIVSNANPTTVEYLLYFVVFGLTAFLMPYRYDFQSVLRFILVFGAILVWPYVSIDYAAVIANVGGVYDNVNAVFMDISYKTLVFVVSGTLVAVTDDNKWIKFAGVIIAIPYLLISFIYGARGVLLSVFVFVFLLWFLCSKNRRVLERRTLTAFFLCITLLVLFPLIVYGVYSLLQAVGVEARSVERLFESVSSNGSLSTGRDVLTKKAVEGFLESPLWGKGIGSFDDYSGTYPHNIILQLLYEGGVLLALPIMYCLFHGMYTMMSLKYDRRYRFFLLMLFSSGVIELFLSSHLWMSLFFWLFIGLSLMRKKFYRHRRVRRLSGKRVERITEKMGNKCFMTLYGPLESDARVLRSLGVFKAVGKEVTIVTCNTREGYSAGDGVDVVNLRLKVGHKGYLYFCIRTLLYYLGHARQFDLIYLQDFLSAVPGLLIRHFARNKRMIYDAHELIIPKDGQCLSKREAFFIGPERRLCNKVDVVIEANKERADLIRARYGLNNVTYVLNITKQAYNGRVRTLPGNGKIVLTYQGVISKERELSFFVDCLKALPERYQMLFIGDGDALLGMQERAEQLGVASRIEFTGRLSNEEMLKRLDDCHIGIISYPFTSYNNIYCSPNKIFEYAALGLPFIATEQPIFKNAQEQYHTGRTFRYGDVASFVEETEFLAKEYSTEFRQFERFLTDFSFNNEMERLRSIITQEA